MWLDRMITSWESHPLRLSEDTNFVCMQKIKHLISPRVLGSTYLGEKFRQRLM